MGDESAVLIEIGPNLRHVIEKTIDVADRQCDDVGMTIKKAFNLDLTRSIIEKVGGEIYIKRLEQISKNK